MTEYSPSQEFENEMKLVMSVPEVSQEFVTKLASKMQEHVNIPRRAKFRPRLAYILLAIVLAITISVVAIGPQKVLAAIEKIFGYIPGIGLVEQDGSLRILSEPIELVRDGITLRLEEVIADSNHTVVVFSVNNIPLEDKLGFFEDHPYSPSPLLALPDNQLLQIIGGEGRGWRTGYESKMIFPAIAQDVNHIILLIPILNDVREGVAPEDWMIEFELVPAPLDYTMMPVYVISATETPSSVTEQIENQQTGLIQDNPTEDQEISVILNRVIELEDGFIFEGKNKWTRESDFNSAFVSKFMLYDSNGQEIPTNTINPDIGYNDYTYFSSPWAFEIIYKDYPTPWTIVINHMNVTQDLSNVEFSIDLGASPQLDKVWKTSIKLEVAGKEIEIIEYRIYAAEGRDEGRIWLELKFDSDPSIYGFSIKDLDFSSPMGNGHSSEGEVKIGIGYYEIPTGVRHMQIEEFNHALEGDWQIEWELPSTVSGPALPDEKHICLTSEIWEELRMQDPLPLPINLEGHWLLRTLTPESQSPLALFSLNDSSINTLVHGTWSSISPDGSSVAFSGNEGLYIIEIGTGDIQHVSNTTQMDEYPIWSLDSQWIYFLRNYDGFVYRIRPDGNELEKLFYIPNIVYPSGFIPGENSLYYVAVSQDGVSYRKIDLQTGISEELFLTDNTKPNSRPVLSPDGDWYLYSDRIFGLDHINIKISRPDGSDEKQLTSLETLPVSPGAWSLDGEWVIVNVHHTEKNVSKITPVLIQPSTCAVIVLTDNMGQVTGWGK